MFWKKIIGVFDAIMLYDSRVYVHKTDPKTLVETVAKAVSPALKKFDNKRTVFFKVNGNCDKYYPGSNTSPWFLDAAIRAFQSEGFKDITVIEGDLFEFKVEKMLERTYLGNVAKKLGAKAQSYENLPRDSQNCPLFLEGAQLVNLPVLHTHGFAKISVAVKNLWGLLPVWRRKLHRQMNSILLGLYRKYELFNLADGTVGMVGDSTRTGLPVELNLVVSGWDALAVDCVCAKIMGFETREIPLLDDARASGLSLDYRLEGDFAGKPLPKSDFHFSDTAMRRITRWLECMENPSPLNELTSKMLQLDPIDFAYNTLRAQYNNKAFSDKRAKIFSGNWMQYESCVPYIKFAHE